eukprot:TRINITY_DN941_c0_g1_i1.p1 TRINITY_DN941_c0_g1~~TRINITY_DN941_c0_g1_i1.p1  ORF type:complete len:236 (-),score=68.26 TRINITY_DN941_c0_g1_i1:237-944(-)
MPQIQIPLSPTGTGFQESLPIAISHLVQQDEFGRLVHEINMAFSRDAPQRKSMGITFGILIALGVFLFIVPAIGLIVLGKALFVVITVPIAFALFIAACCFRSIKTKSLNSQRTLETNHKIQEINNQLTGRNFLFKLFEQMEQVGTIEVVSHDHHHHHGHHRHHGHHHHSHKEKKPIFDLKSYLYVEYLGEVVGLQTYVPNPNFGISPPALMQPMMGQPYGAYPPNAPPSIEIRL